DGQALAYEIVPTAQGLGKIKRKRAELEVIADENRPGQSQNDHHHVALVPEEIAIGVTAAVEAHDFAQDLNELRRLGVHESDIDRLLRRLRLRPSQEILAEEEHKEDQESEGVESPEYLAPKDHPQRDAGDGPNRPGGLVKLAAPGPVV